MNISGHHIGFLVNLNALEYPIKLEGFDDPKNKVYLNQETVIARIPDRCQDPDTGKTGSSVVMVSQLPDGRYVILENSMKNFLFAVKLFEAADKDDAEKKSSKGN